MPVSLYLLARPEVTDVNEIGSLINTHIANTGGFIQIADVVDLNFTAWQEVTLNGETRVIGEASFTPSTNSMERDCALIGYLGTFDCLQTISKRPILTQ